MAASISIIKRLKMGNAKASIVDITFDSSYPTGGESVTPEQCGMKAIDLFNAGSKSGYSFEYNRSTKKLLAYVPINAVAGDGVADANNTLMKSATATVEVAGDGTAFQVPGAEAANATDLSSIATRAFVVGW